MADLRIPSGRRLTPEEFAALLAGGPTYSDVSRPVIGPRGTASNRGTPIPIAPAAPTAPMGELFDPAAYGGSVTQNPTRPIYAPPPPPAAAATAAQAAGQPGSSAYNDSNTSYYTPAGYHDPAGGFIPYSSSNQMPLYYANGGNYPGS